MALFKILKGSSTNLSSQKIREGYCYVTTDEAKMYIDISDTERICLNTGNADYAETAGQADKLSYKRLINGVEFDGSSDIYFYGTCSTAAGTAAKTVTLQSGSSFILKTGATIAVKFTNKNTASSPTLNVNGTGAKPVYRYGTTAASTSDTTSGWRAGSLLLLTYDGTGWIRHFWENTNTVPAGYCSTAADTAAKTATCTDYVLKTNSYLHLIIKTANTAASALTLNVNGKGAKPIYINGAASSASNYTLPAGSYITYYNGTNYYIRTDGKLPGSIESATTANNLGNYTVGGTTQPVYFNGGVPTAVSAVGTKYGGTGNTSYTANRVVYASTATKLASSNLSMSGYEASITASDTTGTKFKITNSNGSVSLLSSTNRGMYDETNSKWIVYTNTAGDHTYVINWKSKGSADTPVYFNANGEAVTASKYAGGTQVTLNGTGKSASTASFYAPTAAGTAGYILKSNGSGKAPTWDTIGNLMNSTFVNVTGDTMTGNLVVTNTDNSISINTGGTITQQVTTTGGWARGTSWNHKSGDTVTSLGCTGMFGLGATTTYFYIGDAYNETWMKVTPGGHVTATKFIGDLQGAASKLSTSAGSTSQPVYFNGGVPTVVTAVGAAYGGTGKTSLVDSANALLNALSTGASVPEDNDYYISQYVNGGTTTTTYHRRPVSKLYEYIKKKASGTWAIDISGNAASATYATSAGTAGTAGSANTATTASYAEKLKINGITNDVTYGTYGGIIQSSTGGPNEGKWHNSIKILHSNDDGYYTQLAQQFTGDHGLWHRSMRAGTLSNWYHILDSGNYTTYTVKKDGTGASGTWGINITGNANYATSAGSAGSSTSSEYLKTSIVFTPAETALTPDNIYSLIGQHGRIKRGTWNYAGNGYIEKGDTATSQCPYGAIDLAGTTVIQAGNGTTQYTQLYITPPTASTSGAIKGEMLYYINNGSNYSPTWYRVLTDKNFNSYAPKKDGTGASGTWGISVTGNAATATNATNANYATSAGTAGSATKDGAGNTIATYYAPKNHASTATTYGVGDATHYGHVILYPAESCTSYTSDSGGAVTPAAAKKAVTLFTNDYAPTKTGGGASGTWGISISGNAASASTAGTAGKLLDTVSVGSAAKPVYFSKGSPVACTTPASGAWFGGIPVVGSDGVQEIGRYIDFHYTKDSTNDYDVRIDCAGANKNTIYLPGITGQVVVHTNDTAIGGADTPIYIAATGAATATSKYAGGTQVKLNNVSKSASTAEFYAPTAAGTAGQVLKSSGSGKAPVWANISDLMDSRFVNVTGDTMTGNLKFTSEKSTIYKIERKVADGGGWAYSPIKVVGNDDAVFANIGVYGGADALTYMFFGAGSWDSDINLRISPTGAVTAKSFVGPLTGNATSATTATKDSSGAVIKDTYVKKAGDTMSGALNTSYQSSTWINSANGKSAINLTGTGYTGWISGNSKDGRLVISSYPNNNNLLYFGYMSNTRIEAGTNSFEQSMTWDGSTNTLTATTFKGALDGNAKTATTATKMAEKRTITLTGDVTGSASSDWTSGWSITATVKDDSHNHVIDNVDGLQAALNGKMPGSPTYIELNTTGELKNYGGFIDFHHHDANGNPSNPTSDGKTPDYTSRIIEKTAGTLDVNGVTFAGGVVTGTLKGTADKAVALTTSAGSASRPVYFTGGVPKAITAVGAAYGGTGKTSLIDSANVLLNALSTGSSTPVDNDYFISQYVGGGTTTTTYHRRPVSKLYDYIKGKAEGTWAISITGNATTATNANYATTAGSAGSAGTADVATKARLTEVILNDTSNWKLGLQWRNTTLESGKYLAGIGRHNTGGNANNPGTISIIPYATDADPWGGTVGLFISKDSIKFENQTIIHSGNHASYDKYHTRAYSSGLKIGTGTNTTDMYVPNASTSQAGVVTTAAQSFAGGKTFTGSVILNNGKYYGGLSFKPTLGTNAMGQIYLFSSTSSGTTYTKNQFALREYSYTADSTTRLDYYEDYVLPSVTAGRTANATYSILTSKNVVTTAQGGTGLKKFTANRMLYTSSTSAIGQAHYVNASKVAINSTSEPSYNLYVSGTGYFTNRVYANEWLEFTTNSKGIWWSHADTGQPHLCPNTVGTYGNLMLRSTTPRGGYNGFLLGNSTNYMAVMSSDIHQGLYNEANSRWIMYYNKTYDHMSIGVAVTGDSDYLLTVGGATKIDGTLWSTGNIWGDHLYPNTTDTYNLGSTSYVWSTGYMKRLHLYGATNATMTADSTNPGITFSESGTQPVHLIYTDYDSYRSPAGLKVVGGSSATPAWFEVEGAVFSARAAIGGYNNTTYALSTSSFICNSWVRTVGNTGWYNETHGGGWYMTDGTYVRTYNSKAVLANNSYYVGTTAGAGTGLSLYSTSAPDTYGIHMSLTSTYGKHGDVQGDWANYFCFSGATNRGWIFRQAGTNVASISGSGYMRLNGQLRNTAYKGGMWVHGRDNALVRNMYSTSSSSFAPIVSAKTQKGSWELGPCNPNEDFYFNYTPDDSYNAGSNTGTVHPVRITNAGQLYGAVWNDYAEYRSCITTFKAGQVVCENGDDTLSLATERLQPGACIVSDTFGFAIGETDIADCPIAVSGRVLAYPYEPRESYKAGDPVCAGPNGTVSKMTREEVKEYPDRMIGTVSAIPKYETWGQDNVPVNGRIWIKVV